METNSHEDDLWKTNGNRAIHHQPRNSPWSTPPLLQMTHLRSPFCSLTTTYRRSEGSGSCSTTMASSSTQSSRCSTTRTMFTTLPSHSGFFQRRVPVLGHPRSLLMCWLILTATAGVSRSATTNPPPFTQSSVQGGISSARNTAHGHIAPSRRMERDATNIPAKGATLGEPVLDVLGMDF